MMENQPNPPAEPAQEGGAKKRPRIPFKHKISVKPSDLDEMTAQTGVEPEEDPNQKATIQYAEFDLDHDSSEEEWFGQDTYLDDADLDDDALDETSGRQTRADSDLDVSADELDPEIYPEEDGEDIWGSSDEEYESKDEDDY
jgi:hypothetical protein